MEQADFVHLVRLSEHASAENSRAYRRSVAAFAALGYAWVLGCLVLGAALVAWVVPQLLQGRWRLGLVLLLLTALALFWTSLRALWVRAAPRSLRWRRLPCSMRSNASGARSRGHRFTAFI